MTRQPTRPPNNTLGLLALVLGVAALPLVFCFALALPAGIAAVVLGWLGLRRVDEGLATNRGQARTGLICGATAAILMIIVIALPD